MEAFLLSRATQSSPLHRQSGGSPAASSRPSPSPVSQSSPGSTKQKGPSSHRIHLPPKAVRLANEFFLLSLYFGNLKPRLSSAPSTLGVCILRDRSGGGRGRRNSGLSQGDPPALASGDLPDWPGRNHMLSSKLYSPPPTLAEYVPPAPPAHPCFPCLPAATAFDLREGRGAGSVGC